MKKLILSLSLILTLAPLVNAQVAGSDVLGQPNAVVGHVHDSQANHGDPKHDCNAVKVDREKEISIRLAELEKYYEANKDLEGFDFAAYEERVNWVKNASYEKNTEHVTEIPEGNP